MAGFLKNHWHTIVFSLGGPALGLITTFIYFQIVDKPNFAMGYGLTLLITVVSHVAFTTIIVAQKTDEVKEKIAATSDEFKKFQAQSLQEHLKINSLNDIEADERISKAILDADTVKNTYINISQHFGAGTSAGKAAIMQYENFLSRVEGPHWIDVTTYGDIHEGRFDLINLKGKANGKHTIHIANSETDVVNFLIIEKNKLPTEVFFGWISDAMDSMRIFQTREPSLIDLFENYFNLLRDKSIEFFDVDYQKERPLLPSRTNTLVGRWLTVSLIKKVKTSTDYRRYSILDIKIDEGAWTVNVEVFERSPNRKVSVITTKHAQAYGRSIFYEFERRNILGDIEEEGLATYSVTDVSDDVISGVYVIPGKGKLVRTYATRLSDEDVRSGNTDSASMEKYIKKLLNTPELELMKLTNPDEKPDDDT